MAIIEIDENENETSATLDFYRTGKYSGKAVVIRDGETYEINFFALPKDEAEELEELSEKVGLKIATELGYI